MDLSSHPRSHLHLCLFGLINAPYVLSYLHILSKYHIIIVCTVDLFKTLKF